MVETIKKNAMPVAGGAMSMATVVLILQQLGFSLDMGAKNMAIIKDGPGKEIQIKCESASDLADIMKGIGWPKETKGQ